MDFKKFFPINSTNLVALLLGLIGAYVLLPIYFESTVFPLGPITAPWMSLDPSWNLNLNYASMSGMRWGTDIIFTYGPLSHLATKVGWGHHGIDFFLYDAFLFVNFFLLFFLSYRDSQSKLFTGVLICAFLVIFPIWLGSSNAIVLMALLAFWIRRSLDDNRMWLYFFQVTLLVLAFFIKFNTGLIAFPLFYAGIAYNLFKHKGDKKTMVRLGIIAASPIVVIGILCVPLNVAPFDYFYSGMELVSGYNDIMFVTHLPATKELAYYIIAAPALVLLYQTYLERKTFLLRNLVLLFLFGTTTFVLYKQGFVRGQEIDFFIYVVLLFVCLSDLHSVNWKKIPGIASGALVLISCAISCSFVFEHQDVADTMDKKLDKHWWEGLTNFTPTSGFHLYPNNNALPQDVLSKIGNATVDAYPWNSQTLFENKLNYKPRPAFQAYTAYTEYLEDRNFECYNDPSKAPEFIVYDYTAVDGRYALLDEPKVNLAITRNYTVERTFDFQGNNWVLLRKKPNFTPIKLIESKTYELPFDAQFPVKKDIYYKIETGTSLMGKIRTIIEHGPEVKIRMYGHKDIHEIRTSSKLLKSGLFSDTYFDNVATFADYISDGTAQNGDPIKFYTLYAKEANLFSDTITVTEYKITQ